MTDEASDDLRLKMRTPWVSNIIIAINLAVFAVSAAMGLSVISTDPDRLVAIGGSLPALTLSGQPWRLLTAMFLHAGLLHIAFNMFTLYSGGRVAEFVLGRRSFLAIYLCAGLVGSIAAMTKTAMIVTVGASGAIFGVFGAIFAYLVAHRAQLDPDARAKQMKSMGTFLVLNLAIGYAVPQISLAAHVGGFVAGFVIAYLGERGTDITDKPAAMRRRFPRVMIGSALALAVVGAGLVALPKSPVAYMTGSEAKQVNELQARFVRFAPTEKELLATQAAAADRAVKGEITNQEHARILREELVPSWRWLGQDIASVTGLPEVFARRQRVAGRYIAARIAHIEAIVALLAFADDDPAAAAALTKVTVKQDELAAALEQLKLVFAAR